MQNDLLASLRSLPDTALLARLEELAASERGATSGLVAHLAELELRRLHLGAGYGSLFAYCREALGLSEHEAYNRIEGARAARRFPLVLDLLAEGALNLTALRLLAPHLTPENHRSVLESARGKRRIEVEEIVARLAPLPDVPPWLRKLPPPRPAPQAAPLPAAPPPDPTAAPLADSESSPGGGAPSGPTSAMPASVVPGSVVPGSAGPAAPPAPSRPPGTSSGAVTTPLAPERYKLQVTIGAETLAKLRLAKDMLGHALPSGDDAAVLDRALTALLGELSRKKFAATDRPRPAPGTSPLSRHIPAEVKRAVWVRDLGRCAFVGTSGRRCEALRFLEFHHVKPYAVGGEPTAGNVELRCRQHNDYEARVFFARGESGELMRHP